MSRRETRKTDLHNRLKELREQQDKSQAEMASTVGRSQQTWGAYESGTSTPPVEVIQKILVEFDVDGDWLLTGQGEMQRLQSVGETSTEYIYDRVPEGFDPSDVVFVPVYGTPLGAGQAGNASMVDVRGYMAWERRWLRREARINPKRAFVAQVYGQSMESLISNGDLVLGEQQEMVDHDGVYAIRVAGELFVKHVMKRGQELSLVSENDKYETMRLTVHDDAHIIGRIVAKVGAV